MPGSEPFAVEDHLIPLERGQAVSPGWTTITGRRPRGVTWHWSATWDLAECTRLLGGTDPARKGAAAAHLAVGRSFAEGVHRYVSLEHRAWHAGKDQTLRWDGKALNGPRYKASRTTIGIETINIGYAREGVEAEDDWVTADGPDGQRRWQIQSWSDEQLTMMIAVGRRIARRWPMIGPRDHHGHVDLCPGYKLDPLGFPFARLLRGIYGDPEIPDLWTATWRVAGRQRLLAALGHPTDKPGEPWGTESDSALRRFQERHGLVPNGMWSTFVAWRLHDVLAERGLVFEEVAG